MHTTTAFSLFVISAALLPLSFIGEVQADDPLNAFPTALAPVEARLQELTDEQLKAIRLPDDAAQMVLSLATIPIGADPTMDPRRREPWLTVYADGSLDCRHPILWQSDRCEDRLERAELLWLLHLAVNECQIPERSSADVEEDFERRRNSAPKRNNADRPAFAPIFNLDSLETYVYEVNLPVGQSKLRIPDKALILRPLRRDMKLDAFASLNKYAYYLASRPYLGNLADRNYLLVQMNQKLKAEDPTVPDFRIEDLGSASNTEDIHLSAVFKQVIELQTDGEHGRKFKEVTAIVVRRSRGSKPEITLNSNEYWKSQF
jgi:hypothetical protein